MTKDKIRLYFGLTRNEEWYNYAEIFPCEGGTLAMLDTGDKTGISRFKKLVKGSVKTLYSEEGKSYNLIPADYGGIRAIDAWKIGYEQIKITTDEEHPIIPENFFCEVCSRPNEERYTPVRESWQKLIDDGLIDEVFSDDSSWKFEVKLECPIVVPQSQISVGGEFDTLIMQPVSLDDVMLIQKDNFAMSTEANQIFATWDIAIVNVPGLSDRELNTLKRTPESFFTKTYLDPKNYETMERAMVQNAKGIDASDRKVYCSYCGGEIGGYLDQTNFFSPLLPKPFSRKGM
ncbi:MAG: hypothetical protein GY853_01870 [PVC group bacterium]|nr:hypothetical protein [PVC group bacterium]